MNASLKPYLLRATYNWCCDQSFTPYLVIQIDEGVKGLPSHLAQHEHITLNISPNACADLSINEKQIEFSARFGGKATHLFIPTRCVITLFAHENSEGVAFEYQPESSEISDDSDDTPVFTVTRKEK